MTRSRDNSHTRIVSVRNLARVAVAGVVVAGTPLIFGGTANAASDSTWDQIAQCESGGKWSTSTGNGYSGGLQFSPSTWRAYGGHGSAHGASKGEQIKVAEKVLAAQGWGAWPSCSKKVSAKGGSSSSARTVSKSTSGSKSSRTALKKTVSDAENSSSQSSDDSGSDDDD